MNDEQRDALRERNRRRAIACTRCGSTSTREVDGAELASDSHWPGVTYKVCSACGFEDVKRVKRSRREL